MKLDGNGESGALRLRPAGREDGAVLKDEATDLLSEAWVRGGRAGDASFIP